MSFLHLGANHGGRYLKFNNWGSHVINRINKKTQSGFTLIELLIVVAIIGILSATFVSMGTLVRDFRVGYINQRLYNSILLARSEAIKRSKNVTLCRSTSGSRCSSGSNWGDGWMVFYDDNGNKQVDGSDQIVRVYNNVSSDFRVSWNGSSNGLFFNIRGQVDFNNTSQFTICLRSVRDSPIRRITVYGRNQGGGRVKSTTDRGSC